MLFSYLQCKNKSVFEYVVYFCVALWDKIKSPSCSRYPIIYWINIMLQILNCLKQLRQRKICTNDLKSEYMHYFIKLLYKFIILAVLHQHRARGFIDFNGDLTRCELEAGLIWSLARFWWNNAIKYKIIQDLNHLSPYF